MLRTPQEIHKDKLINKKKYFWAFLSVIFGDIFSERTTNTVLYLFSDECIYLVGFADECMRELVQCFAPFIF